VRGADAESEPSCCLKSDAKDDLMAEEIVQDTASDQMLSSSQCIQVHKVCHANVNAIEKVSANVNVWFIFKECGIQCRRRYSDLSPAPATRVG
jgi:hypothetical protein